MDVAQLRSDGLRVVLVQVEGALADLAAAALVAVDIAGPPSGGLADASASRKDVLAALGAPTMQRGTVRNDYGELVEVWEYWDRESADPRWYYFIGDELMASYRAGDWSKERARIKRQRFCLA